MEEQQTFYSVDHVVFPTLKLAIRSMFAHSDMQGMEKHYSTDIFAMNRAQEWCYQEFHGSHSRKLARKEQQWEGKHARRTGSTFGWNKQLSEPIQNWKRSLVFYFWKWELRPGLEAAWAGSYFFFPFSSFAFEWCLYKCHFQNLSFQCKRERNPNTRVAF